MVLVILAPALYAAKNDTAVIGDSPTPDVSKVYYHLSGLDAYSEVASVKYAIFAMRMDNNGEAESWPDNEICWYIKVEDGKWVTFSPVDWCGADMRRWRNYARYFPCFQPLKG